MGSYRWEVRRQFGRHMELALSARSVFSLSSYCPLTINSWMIREVKRWTTGCTTWSQLFSLHFNLLIKKLLFFGSLSFFGAHFRWIEDALVCEERCVCV